MSTDGQDDGFLDRWARRKKAVEEEVADRPEPQDAGEDAAAEPQTDEEALDVLRERDPELAEQVSAIDIDKLTYDDDFSVFMNKKVPEFLRRKALSKLWLSSPVLANVDGLNDYDEDFRNVGSVLEAVQTALNKDKPDESAVAEAPDDEAEDGAAPSQDVAQAGPDPATDDGAEPEEEPDETTSGHGDAQLS